MKAIPMLSESSALLKDGALEWAMTALPTRAQQHESLRRAIKRLNHQAKRRDRRDREERDWKR